MVRFETLTTWNQQENMMMMMKKKKTMMMMMTMMMVVWYSFAAGNFRCHAPFSVQ
jgi:hypothetical protein